MIRKLPSNIVNQIAAGEVVERPASVLKELLENAIDAGAKNIEIRIIDGGKSLISVKDDGGGISYDELPLAIERHATSKLLDDNLFNIHTFGFRGEALASICSIARVCIKSKHHNCDNAYELYCANGDVNISPTVLSVGSVVEVSDLFFATPARLKFLKSTHTEADTCFNIFSNVALALPQIGFKYFENNKEKINLLPDDDISKRVIGVLGNEFFENTQYIDFASDIFKVHGFISVPNYNKANQSFQRFFVNGRYVKDKILSAALRNAYKEVVPAGRYPVCLLFISIDSNMVDVNVHPAKTEVRFSEPDAVISKLYGIIKKQISEGGLGQQASTAAARLGLNTVVNSHVENFEHKNNFLPSNTISKKYHSYNDVRAAVKHENDLFERNNTRELATSQKSLSNRLNVNEKVTVSEIQNSIPISMPKEDCAFGHAIAQLDNTYIVAEKQGELIIIDQHAVCERITLEKLLNRESIDSQQLLLPEIIVTERSKVEIVVSNLEMLASFGLLIEKMSEDTICVRGIPSILGDCNVKDLVDDVLEELNQCGTTCTFENKIRSVYATMACHRSVRAGKILSIQEMDHLLHQMEATNNIAQCCHGRPSYIKISVNDLGRMFER